MYLPFIDFFKQKIGFGKRLRRYRAYSRESAIVNSSLSDAWLACGYCVIVESAQ